MRELKSVAQRCRDVDGDGTLPDPVTHALHSSSEFEARALHLHEAQRVNEVQHERLE